MAQLVKDTTHRPQDSVNHKSGTYTQRVPQLTGVKIRQTKQGTKVTNQPEETDPLEEGGQQRNASCRDAPPNTASCQDSHPCYCYRCFCKSLSLQPGHRSGWPSPHGALLPLPSRHCTNEDIFKLE